MPLSLLTRPVSQAIQMTDAAKGNLIRRQMSFPKDEEMPRLFVVAAVISLTRLLQGAAGKFKQMTAQKIETILEVKPSCEYV